MALGEADATWPKIVEDAARGQLKEVYAPVDDFGQERKPNLGEYPQIPWESIDLEQFNRIPAFLRPLMRRFGIDWERFHLIPIESGRGCPYGCEFCTVTGFFGDSIRFRTNQSVVQEMLRLKALARQDRGKVAVFFVDDNFLSNQEAAKSFLRDLIPMKIRWVSQASLDMTNDLELMELLARSGCLGHVGTSSELIRFSG